LSVRTNLSESALSHELGDTHRSADQRNHADQNQRKEPPRSFAALCFHFMPTRIIRSLPLPADIAELLG
jgi:hypothetical protein